MASQYPPRHLNCVAIGGGTGLSTLLKGLKSFVFHDGGTVSATSHAIDHLTAVVTVTDDGGSSGRLREEFQMLPPGDIRNCLVALSEDERLLSRLFQYRFPGQGGVRGHSFGNLFLAALTGVTGDFLEAVKLCSEVLAIRGNIVPSTTTDVTLVAELADGFIVRGESRITASGGAIKRISLDPPKCRPLPETLDAIARADLITLGPGSLFTSIIPNLLVDGVAKAIAESAALKVYICNIMTQPGETENFTVADHVEQIVQYLPADSLDAIIVNNGRVSPNLRAKYREEGAKPITFRIPPKKRVIGRKPLTITSHLASSPSLTIGSKRIPVMAFNLIEETDLVRHSPAKLAKAVLAAYDRFRADRSAFKPMRKAGTRR